METTGIVFEVSEKLTAKNGTRFYKVKFGYHLNETGLMFTEEEIKKGDKLVYTRAQNEITRAITYKFIRKEKRVYKGFVQSLRLINMTAFGIREYEVNFKTGRAFFQISSKRTLPISTNTVISFTGEFYGNNFIIDEVFDVTSSDNASDKRLDWEVKQVELPKGNGFTADEMKLIMNDAQMNEVMQNYTAQC